MNPSSDPDKTSLGKSVTDVLTFFGYLSGPVRIHYPPAVDDFDPTERQVWEHWDATQRRGGYVQFPRGHKPTETQYRRLVAFAELVIDHPAQEWLHETLTAFKQYGPYIPSTQEDGQWVIHPPQERLRMPQAIILRVLDGLLAHIDKINDLPNPHQLGIELLNLLDFQKLAVLAIGRRRRAIILNEEDDE